MRSEGCGSLTFPVRVRDEVELRFVRRPRASWTWCLNGEIDGRVVMTRGPDSNPEYTLDVYWSRLPEGTSVAAVEPVRCAGQ